jgi:AcrR family transcriptional regulator
MFNMNTVNNAKRKQAQSQLRDALLELLKTKNIGDISITEISEMARVDRSTFYSNYPSVRELMKDIGEEFHKTIAPNYRDGHIDALVFIKNHQDFYRAYYKLGLDHEHIPIKSEYGAIDELDDYRIAFYQSGITAVLRNWVNSGCKESPKTISKLITQLAF